MTRAFRPTEILFSSDTESHDSQRWYIIQVDPSRTKRHQAAYGHIYEVMPSQNF